MATSYQGESTDATLRFALTVRPVDERELEPTADSEREYEKATY